MGRKKEFSGVERRSHSVTYLAYHAVFVVKYRRKVIDSEIMDFMKQHAEYLITERYNGQFLDLNGEEDHIHILFTLPPSMAPATAVCSLKTQLSKEVRARFMERIKDKLWNGEFWSGSYYLATSDGANLDTLQQYLDKQGVEREKRKYTRRT